MAFLNCNGCKIAYQQMGEGPDLIMIHGLATNRAFWFADIAQRFKSHFRITLYDLRGHAYSERCASGYSARAMADDLADLMDQLNIDRAHLLGHSFGGGIALEYALLHPQRVGSLCLLDTKVNSLQPEQRLSDNHYLSEFEREVLAADPRDWAQERHIGLKYLERLAQLRVDGFEAQTKSRFTPFGAGRSGLRSAKQYLSLIEQTKAEQQFMQPGATEDEIVALQPETLLLYGEQSRCMPSGQKMSALLPQAAYRIVPQAGHFFPATHSDYLAQELLAFWRLGTAQIPATNVIDTRIAACR